MPTLPRFVRSGSRGARLARTLASITLVLASQGAASAAASGDPASITGIWRTDVSKLVADATVYFVLDADSSCRQVGRIKLLGISKWIVRTCSWRLDGDFLTLSLAKSATPDEEKENTTRIAVTEITADSLVISADGEVQRWTRASELPAPFQAHLEALSSP